MQFALDQPLHAIELRLGRQVWTNDEEPDLTHTVELFLSTNGNQRQVGTATLLPQSTATIALTALDLGPPGTAHLTAAVVGTESTATAVVMKSALVQLNVRSQRREANTIALEVTATTAAGHVPSGRVIARQNDQVVAVGPLHKGEAKLSVPRSTLLSRSVEGGLELQFEADAPWWTPPEPLALESLSPAFEQQLWVWLIALSIVALAFLPHRKGRPLTRPETPARESTAADCSPASKRQGPASAPGAPPAQPASQPSGWGGRLVDAHDGRPLSGIRVAVTIPSLRGSPPILTTTTDRNGQFRIESGSQQIPDGTPLTAEGPWHQMLRHELRGYGYLQLTMVSRKRALLERLVGYARRSLNRRVTNEEPTPTQILQSLLADEQSDAAAWAHSMRAAIYGPRPVGAETEAQLTATQPQPPTTGPRASENRPRPSVA